MLNGCPTSGYQSVPGQLPGMSPLELYTHLTTACPSKAENNTCLASDNGNNFHNATEEWQTLVGKTFTMPVLCVRTKCSELAVKGSGANASYAIQSIATVELCGFKLNPRPASTGWPTTGPCATSNPRNYTPTSVMSGGGLFVVVKGLSASDSPAWTLTEYKDVQLTK